MVIFYIIFSIVRSEVGKVSVKLHLYEIHKKEILKITSGSVVKMFCLTYCLFTHCAFKSTCSKHFTGQFTTYINVFAGKFSLPLQPRSVLELKINSQCSLTL